MKFKVILSAISAICVITAPQSSAATYNINNVVVGDNTDYLFQNSNGSALNGGIVTLGYFTGGAPSTNISDIAATITAFSQQASGITGAFSADLGGNYAGYVQVAPASGASITAPNTLLDTTNYMYVFAGNDATLATSTAWALARVKVIASDSPTEQSYSANPIGSTIHGNIGTFSTFTGDVGLGNFTYNTLRLQAIPEPSTFLLASLGVFALLRRRRH